MTEIIDNGVKLTQYTYHPDGSLKSLQQANHLSTHYAYDQDKNLSRLAVNLQDKQLIENHYTYDNNGNRLTKQQLTGQRIYHYDPLNRLTEVNSPTYTEKLYYDKLGNRTSHMVHNLTIHYSYDVANHLTSIITQ